MARNKNAPAGCLVLFGIPFFLAGCFVIYLGISSLFKSWEAESWSKQEATITELELKRHHDSDGTTYTVTAKFNYEYLGSKYSSDQVNFDSGSDNIGSYHQKKYRELKQKKDQAQGISCYVNPADPNQAVLDREIRTEM